MPISEAEGGQIVDRPQSNAGQYLFVRVFPLLSDVETRVILPLDTTLPPIRETDLLDPSLYVVLVVRLVGPLLVQCVAVLFVAITVSLISRLPGDQHQAAVHVEGGVFCAVNVPCADGAFQRVLRME